ncbi:thaumatin-like protein [Wolffia australiana]
MAFFPGFLFFFFLQAAAGAEQSQGRTLTLYNACAHTVWPGLQPGAGHPILAAGGFELAPGHSRSLALPAAWSGRVWPRLDCTFDRAGLGRCASADCAAGLRCAGAGGVPPATLAELTLGPTQDFYDVSLVDGYNLGLAIEPVRPAGSGRCARAGCAADLNRRCPAGLAVRAAGQVVGCRSACSAFGSDRFCCTGSFGGPQNCRPTSYSKMFKDACPTAYSYAYDDPSSILTCTGADYLVTFCPHS